MNWKFPGFSQTNDHPVVCVNVRDAKAYINWLRVKTGKSYRLLSETEWEYMARAGTTTTYPWGNSIDLSKANFFNRGGTVPVSRFGANAFGVYGTVGNVWEYTEDCRDNLDESHPTDGSAITKMGDCYWQSVRGGGWSNPPWRVRTAFVSSISGGDRYNCGGFRVAMTLSR